jgi:hygromycin-B 7''-O-kinase
MAVLPPAIGVAAFDALHDDAPAWRAVIESIAAEHGGGPVRQRGDGTVLVALLGSDRVLKLYPPFLRDHCEFERAVLARLHGRLSLPTPRLLATGERDGWPYHLMTQLPGEVLTGVWPSLTEARKCELLGTLGALATQVHALPVGELVNLAPRWDDFVQAQRQRCQARQQRTGLPAHLLAQLGAFLQGELPQGPAVTLTGEYTPMNLLAQDGRLSGMFDFGDGLVGPREYDWLGPLCFLAAGHAGRCQAFMQGIGAALDADMRLRLLRLLLLHRYSNLPAQVAMPGWQQAGSFEELAALIWP